METGFERGQAIQIGALFIFAFIIIGISVNQAVLVPQQNKQVEFNHYGGLKNDFVQLQGDSISIAGANAMRSSSVTLGTQYPARTLGVNPPPPQGQLERTLTGTAFTVTNSPPDVSDLCGGSTTFGVQYTPSYPNFNAQPVTFENGQVFISGDSNNAFLQTRTIINTDTETIRFYRLVGTIPTRSTAGTVNIELTGSNIIGQANNDEFNGETISVPTQLDTSDWRDDLTTDYSAFDSDGGSITTSSNQADIEIPGGYRIRCYTIGTGNTEPPAANEYDLSTDATSPPGSASQTSVSAGTSTGTGQAKIEFTIENTGVSDATIAEIAVVSTDTTATFVEDEDDPIEFESTAGTDFLNSRINIGGNSQPLDSSTTIAGSSSKSFNLGEFRDGSGSSGRFNMNNQQVTIMLTFSDGSTKQYVINT